ncbi:patatin-like phospholipase family protein [Prosthecodimorpha staleyi]|uniref:Patatin-like phospholipase family protein n=1 Tax=Prosthecodimorpha staleyi TaxID=2840188 RepID=A0A947GFQ4_9HYPH|nr:patatin-like phospholipase family protein [Prosthecodimorpha staleyi]MBT9293091.1 patatin-like phospholipase family protein [Prosthecodimorpha staleyi]
MEGRETPRIDSQGGPATGFRLGLALSGGGVRAAVFHLGVLRRLAEDDLFESVTQISTVSGGSLVIAALVTNAGMQWPGSEQYRSDTYPSLRSMLTGADLLSPRCLGWKGLLRFNLRLLSSRAMVLADLLAERWGVRGNLRDLPERPVWWINATCVETGKNWRFSKREMGDWQFGRHYDPPFRLADAAAASAAVPYAIGALRFELPQQGWYRTDPATRQPLERRDPPHSTVHLWDGGAYENMGLEALFKPGKALIECDFLVCSDASGPLRAPGPGPLGSLWKGHLWSPRLFDVSSDQIRALRSRMLMREVESGTIRAALIRMGNSVRDIDLRAGIRRTQVDYGQYQVDQEATLALLHPTDLQAPSPDLFDRIARHGFEVADATLTAYSPKYFPKTRRWPV